MHEIQRPAGGFVAWKMCENTHTMDAPGCAGEASMWPAAAAPTVRAVSFVDMDQRVYTIHRTECLSRQNPSLIYVAKIQRNLKMAAFPEMDVE